MFPKSDNNSLGPNKRSPVEFLRVDDLNSEIDSQDF